MWPRPECHAVLSGSVNTACRGLEHCRASRHFKIRPRRPQFTITCIFSFLCFDKVSKGGRLLCQHATLIPTYFTITCHAHFDKRQSLLSLAKLACTLTSTNRKAYYHMRHCGRPSWSLTCFFLLPSHANSENPKVYHHVTQGGRLGLLHFCPAQVRGCVADLVFEPPLPNTRYCSQFLIPNTRANFDKTQILLSLDWAH